MEKIIVIGSPGAGKSSFSKKLKNITKLPLYHIDMLYHKKDGTVTVTLTLSTAATICFTTAQNTTFPAAGDPNIVTFEYVPAGGQYIKTSQPVLLGTGTYTFRVPVLNAKPVFLCADWATTQDYLIITQEGKAKIAFNS